MGAGRSEEADRGSAGARPQDRTSLPRRAEGALRGARELLVDGRRLWRRLPWLEWGNSAATESLPVHDRPPAPEPTDEEVAKVVIRLRSGSTGRTRGETWAACEAKRHFIAKHLKDRVRLSKILRLLQREGVEVPYPTLHRFAVAELGFGRHAPTIPVDDGEPGQELQLKTLKHARLDNSYDAELRKIALVDLLIVDDFGLDSLDSVESRDMYEILSERHRTGSMIVTSNRGPDEWLATFADPVRAQSAIDRFANNAYDLVMDGESYRKRLKRDLIAPDRRRRGRESQLARRDPRGECF